MGRHPNGGGPVFRFAHNEVIEMEACLQGLKNATPAREMICALAEKFSASNTRAGKIVVQPKQVWNWFQNRRYSQRTKVRAPENFIAPPVTQDDSVQLKNVVQSASISQGQKAAENSQLEFEAKSARDGAWYDVSAFLSHRKIETDDPEVRVRFSGFGVEEDEWINVRMSVRQRSLPCENIECIALIPGDLILCFQEGIEQALYFDAHILDAQRRRHDIRGCRCRFLVRYDHDQSEEIVPLRKVCRRPETEFRLRQHRASSATTSSSAHDRTIFRACSSRDQNLMPRRIRKQSRLMELSTDESSAISLPAIARHAKDSSIIPAHNATVAADENGEASQNASVLMGGDFVEVQETMEVVEI